MPEDAIVQTGDFVGYMLDKAVEKGVKEIILLGHSGKLVKLAANIFNTHHKVGDARNEVIASYAGAVGADTKTINELLAANTSDEASEILKASKPVGSHLRPNCHAGSPAGKRPSGK